MTETSGKHVELIASDVDVIFNALNYAGCGDETPILFGPECEFFVCKPQGGTIVPIDVSEAESFIALFQEKTGKYLHQELIASHFELNAGPMELETFRDKVTDYFQSVRDIYRIADEAGYRIIPSSHAPHIRGVEDVLNMMTDRERIRIMVPAVRQYLGDDTIKFGNLTAGIHVSSAYRNMEQFYEDLRRSYYLSPFIYALSNNGFPFSNGMTESSDVIPRLDAIEIAAQGPHGRTGIDPLFYEAVGGEDFLKRYIDKIISEPLLGYRKKARGLKEVFTFKDEPGLRDIAELGASPENPVSFRDLQERGLNTIANLQFAASLVWRGVKVQDIPGLNAANGIPVKRLEDRVWNAGTWQIASSLLTRALMRGDEACGREVDGLLEDFGFSPEGPALDPQSGRYLKESTQQAWQHGGAKGLDFVYGKGTALEFGRRYVVILRKYAEKHGLEDYLAPMEHIVRTNETDGRILTQLCRTPEDAVRFIKTYDVSALPDPKKCYGMLWESGLLPVPAMGRETRVSPPHMEVARFIPLSLRNP